MRVCTCMCVFVLLVDLCMCGDRVCVLCVGCVWSVSGMWVYGACVWCVCGVCVLFVCCLCVCGVCECVTCVCVFVGGELWCVCVLCLLCV